MMVCDIKGWGRIQYMDKSIERQNAIGEKVAKLLNKFGDNQNEAFDEEGYDGANTLPSEERVELFKWD